LWSEAEGDRLDESLRFPGLAGLKQRIAPDISLEHLMDLLPT
jgi:hypothetical protein